MAQLTAANTFLETLQKCSQMFPYLNNNMKEAYRQICLKFVEG